MHVKRVHKFAEYWNPCPCEECGFKRHHEQHRIEALILQGQGQWILLGQVHEHLSDESGIKGLELRGLDEETVKRARVARRLDLEQGHVGEDL